MMAHPLETTQPPSVLLADDDNLFRLGFCRLLRSEGFDCHCAKDGAEALAMLRSSHFDALISDIFMPGNVDLELIAEIPQVAAGLPVILLTGRPSVETAVKSVNLSVIGYLVKPPDLAQVCRLLNTGIEAFRACRRISDQRRHFERMNRELERIEKALRNQESEDKSLCVAEYLRLMTNGCMSGLDEMEQALDLLVRIRKSGDVSREKELTNALKLTIEAIEETRQSFKSKRLRRLRMELQGILEGKASVS